LKEIKIGVLGSGSMGSGIAQIAATAGHEVVIFDSHTSAMERSRQNLQKVFSKLVEKGNYTGDEAAGILGRIHYSDRMHGLRGVGFLFEAIVEDLAIKKAEFEQLEDVVGPDCIMATNTSSLSVAAIASACKQPQRVIGIHFFNPAPLMKLVEIIPAIQTGAPSVQQALDLMKKWGKITVVARDTPGFIVNRIARPFYGEALRICEEGLADVATIDWAMKEFGKFRMGPFELMDFIGNDVNFAVTETVFRAFYFDPRYRPSFAQKRLVEAGYLGRKSGRGFYSYAPDAPAPAPVRDEQLARDIVHRIVCMLVNEAADALYWGVATRDDIDLAMTAGMNYPKGLLRWADELGIAHCEETLDRLYEEYHEDRYRCSPLLRKMGREVTKFYEK